MKAAVLGHPISHSLSPVIHSAAIEELGLDINYTAIDVDVDQLADFVGQLDDDWCGLSLTMPLKTEILKIVSSHDRLVELTQSANTVFRSDVGDWTLTNTDVFGICEAVRESGFDSTGSVGILGSGATARSAVAAASELGAQRVFVASRNAQASQEISILASSLGVDLELVSYGSIDFSDCGLVISTLPGDSAMNYTPLMTVDEKTVLLDVSYSPWPSDLARWWPNANVISGKEMLLWQATQQWTRFTHTDAPVNAMRLAMGLKL